MELIRKLILNYKAVRLIGKIKKNYKRNVELRKVRDEILTPVFGRHEEWSGCGFSTYEEVSRVIEPINKEYVTSCNSLSSMRKQLSASVKSLFPYIKAKAESVCKDLYVESFKAEHGLRMGPDGLYHINYTENCK